MKLCPQCNCAAAPEAVHCPGCGHTFPYFRSRNGEVGATRCSVSPAENHDISVAGLLATCLPGGGQIYNGQTAKGVVMILLVFLMLGVAAIYRFTAVFLAVPVLWSVAMVDACMVAGRKVRGGTIAPWQWF